jgi:hypothetical protein
VPLGPLSLPFSVVPPAQQNTKHSSAQSKMGAITRTRLEGSYHPVADVRCTRCHRP